MGLLSCIGLLALVEVLSAFLVGFSCRIGAIWTDSVYRAFDPWLALAGGISIFIMLCCFLLRVVF